MWRQRLNASTYRRPASSCADVQLRKSPLKPSGPPKWLSQRAGDCPAGSWGSAGLYRKFVLNCPAGKRRLPPALTQAASYNDVATPGTATWNDVLAQKGTVKAALDDFVRQANTLLAQEP